MIKEISFSKSDLEYHATVYIFEDGTYDITEFYSFDEDGNSVDLEWKPLKDEIENELSDYIFMEGSGGYFGGYDTFIEGLEKSYY